MKIEEALKPTGKAIRDDQPEHLMYVTEEGGLIKWLNNDGIYELLSYSEGVECVWQPYHEVKEIRPENAGELWKHEGGFYGHTFKDGGEVRWLNDEAYRGEETGEASSLHDIYKVLHNKNGWKLIYSPDKEVMAKINGGDERTNIIKIKGVEMESACNDIILKTSSLKGGTVFNKTKVNVIIELI